jgi:hypothetical protein
MKMNKTTLSISSDSLPENPTKADYERLNFVEIGNCPIKNKVDEVHVSELFLIEDMYGEITATNNIRQCLIDKKLSKCEVSIERVI